MRFKLACLSAVLGLSFISSIYASTNEKLIYAIDVIRHGDRTPIDTFPTAPYEWPEGFGQLTATGMRQEFQLGSHLRKRYVDQYQLLPANYTFETMNVRSTDFDRTLMSAQSFLLGLYPHGTGPKLPDSDESALINAHQPIPIHTIPQDQDTLLLPDSKAYHFKDLLDRYIFSSEEWKAKNIELSPKFTTWGQALGLKITDVYQLQYIGDALYISQLHHKPLPQALSDEDIKEIIEVGRWVTVTILKNKNISDMTGQELLKTVVANLNAAKDKKTKLKYNLFSAHDYTIMAELSALGAPLQKTPPYASDLNFALFDLGYEHYEVRVTYNDEPVFIPGCGGTVCTLEQLQKMVL